MTAITGSPVEQAFIETFNSNLKQAYQGKGKLRHAVTFVSGVGGTQHSFPVMDAGMATDRGAAHSDLTPMTGDTSNVPAIFNDIDATQFIDDFEPFKVNFSIQNGYIMKIAKAITRKEDQIIIDAMDAAATTKTVANNVSGSVANLTSEAVKRAGALLDDDEVDEEGRHFAYTSSQKEALLGLTEVTSTDFANVKALVNGDVDTYMGFKFHMIGRNRLEGGLPIATDDRSCFAWQEEAVGLAMAADVRTSINYSASKGSHVVRSYFSGGAAVIDLAGVVEVICSEA
jgi:hypothetical protein